MRDFKTIEKLQMEICSNGAVLEYKDHVIVAAQIYTGEFKAEIYEFVDSKEDFTSIECRLDLIEKAETRFADGGSAIEWCINKLK